MALCLAVVAVCGCSTPATSLFLDIRADGGFTPPAALLLNAWGDSGPVISSHALMGRVPGSVLIVGLPAKNQTLRVAIDDSGGRALGSARAALAADEETHVQIILEASAPDQDGDGVPDDVDDCPAVADPQQNNLCGSTVTDLAVADLSLPRDFGGADLLADLAVPNQDLAPGALVRVHETAGYATLAVDHVQVTPPSAQPGDLVLLLLDRYSAGSGAMGAVAGWTVIASQMNDGDTQEIGWRTAIAGENTQYLHYNFFNNDDATWMLFVYRNANLVTSTSSATAVAPPFTVPSLVVNTTPAVVLDILANGVSAACSVDADLGGLTDGANNWHFVERSLTMPATVPAEGFACGSGDAALFQVRITQ